MARPKGSLNKLTRSVKDCFQAAFEELQEVEGANLVDWAKANTTEFYKIAAKLIPAQVNMTVTKAAADMADDELASIASGSGEGTIASEGGAEVPASLH